MLDVANVFDLTLVVKIVILIMIGMYTIFVVIIFNSLRSLNKIMHIKKAAGSPLIQTLGFVYLLVTIALFLLALAIL